MHCSWFFGYARRASHAGGVLREASAKGTGVDDIYDDLLDDETEGVLSEYLAALVDLYLVKAAEPVAA